MELLTQRRSLVERSSKTFGSLTRHLNKTIASQAVALLLITLPLAQELSQNKASKPDVEKWRVLLPKVESVLTQQGNPCRENQMRAMPVDAADLEGMSVALIDVCPLGAYTESMVVMRLENDEPVLARFRRGSRKVNPESVRGASVMHGRDMKIAAESKAIYEIAWDNDGVDDEGIVKLQDCVVNAYIWNTKSKTFDWDGKLTRQVTRSYCENLKHQVH